VLTLSAVAVHLFSPAITLVIYAIQAQFRGAKSIDVKMAFTSLAIIDLVATPAVVILETIPSAAAYAAAFDRILIYLLSPDREDMRVIVDKNYTDSNAGISDSIAANLDIVTVRPSPTSDPVLKSISAILNKGNLVVISGAVGTGKTTLARALLGDLPPDSGVIQTAYGSIAYCSQTAWLINGTIIEAICGPPGSDIEQDTEWYRKVVWACDLEEDFKQMPKGDRTIIGSRGITLSGGQKQRVVSIKSTLCYSVLFCVDRDTGTRTGCLCPQELDHS